MNKYKKQWIRAPTVKTIYSCGSLERDSKNYYYKYNYGGQILWQTH